MPHHGLKRSAQLLFIVLPILTLGIGAIIHDQVEKRRAADARFISLWSDSSGNFDRNRAEHMTVMQVQQALDQGVDINAHAPDGVTALMAASQGRDLSLVGLLLDRGADVNALCIAPVPPRRFHLYDLLSPRRLLPVSLTASPKVSGKAALEDAIYYGNSATVKLLVQHGADVKSADASGDTPLMYAAQSTDPPIINSDDAKRDIFQMETSTPGAAQTVQLLLDHGAKVNVRDADGRSALIQTPNSVLSAMLLAHGADPNLADHLGVTPLMMAASDCCLPHVLLLLAHGANIETKDTAGKTALMDAAEYDDEAAFTALLARGANVHQVSHDGETMLMAAAKGGNAHIADLLLKRGLAVNAHDSSGTTPLMLAVQSRYGEYHAPLIKVLLSHGALINARNHEGKTALRLAEGTEDTAVIHLLKSAGAR